MAKGKEEKKKRLVVLDTHAILHRAYHALPDFSSSKGEPTGGLYGLITMLMKLIGELRPDYIIAAVDLPKPTYRHAIYKEYKGTRKELEDALIVQLRRMHDVLEAFGIPLYSAEGYEADDVIGTIVEKLKKQKDVEVVIATGDMDSLQLVEDGRVRVYTLRKGLNDTVMYDEERVKERFGFGPELLPDYKGIRGDPSDNIPGVRGIGEKGATDLIKNFGSLDDIYKTLKKNPKKLLDAGIKQGVIDKLKEQEKQARLSRELGEISRKAPVTFTLPTQSWKEGAHPKEALEMVQELEFRSLAPRVKTLFGLEHTPEQEDDKKPHPHSEEVEKLALAVWVIDSNITEPTLEDVERVGKSEDLEEARKNIEEEIKKRDLEFVYEKIELPLMPVLRTMEKRGVKIDVKFLEKLSKDYHADLEKIAARIYKAAGEEFNINSPKQLGDILFDKLGLTSKKKTAGGARSTRESELQVLAEQHPIVKDVLAYRELQKLLSTYIDAIPDLVAEDGRLHTHYVQASTSTGRLSSKDPNLQNIPIKSDLGRAIRNAFVADEGHELVAFDYSQIELRIAALMTEDKGLMEIFKNGRDAHTEVAARVFGVEPEEVTPHQRRVAKVINFGILYGMGVTSLQQSLGTKRAEAQEFYNHYFMAYPRLADYMEDTKAQAARLGYTKTLFGRRRYFDGIKSPIPYVRAAAERMAINAPIQGTSADIIKLAMVNFADYVKKEGLEDDAHLLLQVHDELVFEIKKEKVEEVSAKIKEIMENVIDEKGRKGIPLLAEGKHGKNWGEMKKIDA